MIQIVTPVVVFTTVVVLTRIAVALSRRTGMGYDGWLILISLVYDLQSVALKPCLAPILPHLQLFLWRSYAMTVLLVKLCGLGRPLVVNLAIDENRLAILLKG